MTAAVAQIAKCRHPKAGVLRKKEPRGAQHVIRERCGACGAKRSRVVYRTGTLGHFSKWGPPA